MAKKAFDAKNHARKNLKEYIEKLEEIALNGKGIAQMNALALLVKLAEAEQDSVEIGPIKISLKPVGETEEKTSNPS